MAVRCLRNISLLHTLLKPRTVDKFRLLGSPKLDFKEECHPFQSRSFVSASPVLHHSDTTEKLMITIARGTNTTPINNLLYQKSTFGDIIDSLLEIGCQEKEITDLFTEQPNLLSCGGPNLKETLTQLIERGFQPNDVMRILHRVPEIVDEPEKLATIYGVIADEMKLGGNSVRKMVAGSPEVILLDPSILRKRFSTLNQFFRKNDLEHMFRKHPEILLLSPNDIQTKVDYVYHTMGLDQVEMVWADVLQHDIKHIRARHLFLDRSGNFEKPDRKGTTRKVNPYLKDIVGRSDKEFAKKIAGLSLGEYEVFKKIMDVERQKRVEDFEGRFDSDDEGDLEHGEVAGYKSERTRKTRMRQQNLDYE